MNPPSKPEISFVPLHPIEIMPGLIHYQQQGGIFVFVCKQMSQEVIDACFAYARQQENLSSQTDQRIRMLIDIRGSWFISPYLITQIILSERKTPKDMRESIAILGDGLTLKVMQTVFHRLPAHLNQSMMIFKDEASAAAWMESRE